MKKESGSRENLFWADQLSGQLIDRAKQEDCAVTCKAAASPSGGKHIGNLFDVMKSFIVYKAVKRKKFPVRFVFTNDDADPLRTIPVKLPTLDAKWVQTEGDIANQMSRYLGHPYWKVPDPFGCCYSWSEHFNRIWIDGIYASGIMENEIEIFENHTLYGEGRFDPYIEAVFRKLEKSREIISRFQEHIKPDYIPFHAICENCNKITTTVTGFSIENKTVQYVCSGRKLAGKYTIYGCNRKGETNWKNGKLSWRFEWPASWGIFKVTFEPFGKEHAEGSWPSGRIIAKEIYGFEPPLPHVYEFLLLNGEKMAARRGNVYIAQEILQILEPEIFMYFYTKRSLKQRNLDLKNIHLLVNDFEHAERVYFGADKETNEHMRTNLIRMYESAMPEIPKKLPVRIDYQFAALVSQITHNLDAAIKILIKTGHLKSHPNADEKDQLAKRLNLAKNWVDLFAPENKIQMAQKIPEEIKRTLTEKQIHALLDIAKILQKEVSTEELYNSFFEIIKERNITSKELFSAAYMVLINKENGPRLAPFIIALGQDRVRILFEQLRQKS